MGICGGIFPRRSKTKLVTLLRDPTLRFVSRLYYELGGQTELLLKPPFSYNTSAWTPWDIREMERISCEACATINAGHCRWRGGICDSPQEYTVVLSRLAPSGHRGALQRKGGDMEAHLRAVSPPVPNTKPLKMARTHAAQRLLEDFSVIGVLEDLHVFLVLLALELSWSPDALLYATRKSHAKAAQLVYGTVPCARSKAQPNDLIQGRISKRRDERLKKHADAVAHQKNGVVFSGVWPLLGWNAPTKGSLRSDTKAYIDRRNADDMYLWTLARLTARDRLAHTKDGIAHKERFDALQRAYIAGVVKDAQGFYVFCDWRVKDHQRSASNTSSQGRNFNQNSACLRCASSLPVRNCSVAINGSAAIRPLGKCNPSTPSGTLPAR